MNMPKTIRLCLFLIIAMPATLTRTDATEIPHLQPAEDFVPRERASPPTAALPVEPPLEPRTHRHLGLAALGLMMTTLGAYWRIHQGNIGRRRWRHLHRARSVSRCPQVPGPVGPHPGSVTRHRIRRFDYDRFYLHMLRNL